jgi:two-component system sensor histidine kinase CreC
VEQHGWLQKRQTVTADELLEAVREAAEMRAAGLDLSVRGTPGLRLSGDPFLLRQALSNLLDNAIAFSPPGAEVVLAAEAADDRVQLSVRDHGPGIPDYARERIFERFYSLARPGSGLRSSGLGLPFVREVARLHGGDIVLRNHPDGGAEAVLTLPAA